MYNETTRLVKVVMPVETEEDILQGETNPILASVNPTRAAGDSDAIMLSDTAENLFIAYEVVAMVKDESTGKTHFSQLKWKKLGEISYYIGGGTKSVADPSGDGEQIGVKGALRYDAGSAIEEETPLYYQFMFESGDLFVASAADEYPALDGDELQMLSDSSSGGGSGGGSTGGGVLVVNSSISDNVVTLDKTFDEIAGADAVFIKTPIGAQGFVLNISEVSYEVEIAMPKAEDQDVSFVAIPFHASSGSGYPSVTLE